jgi:hypothetical protein
MSFSVLRCLETCVSSAMKNARLSSLGLIMLIMKWMFTHNQAKGIFLCLQGRR